MFRRIKSAGFIACAPRRLATTDVILVSRGVRKVLAPRHTNPLMELLRTARVALRHIFQKRSLESGVRADAVASFPGASEHSYHDGGGKSENDALFQGMILPILARVIMIDQLWQVGGKPASSSLSYLSEPPR